LILKSKKAPKTGLKTKKQDKNLMAPLLITQSGRAFCMI
jgi:hypothetical protein